MDVPAYLFKKSAAVYNLAGTRMNLAIILAFVGPLWGLSEIVLGIATRARRGPSATPHDRGSLILLWVVITGGIFAAFAVRPPAGFRISVPLLWMQAAGLILLSAGLIVRWTAILTLGKFFSANVAIHSDHRIVRAGLFRYVRHPSYTGLLMAFAGLTLALDNWFSFLVVVVPVTAALLYRIHVEEAALVEAFGQEYQEYRKTTRRLVPGLY